MLLRDALSGGPDSDELAPSGTITGVSADGTVAVDFGGGRVISSCEVLASYTPASGDSVRVMRAGPASWLVLGTVRTSNPTTVDVTASLSFPFNVTPAAPSGAASPLVVPAATIRSYRDNEGWSGAAESNNAAQGAYSTRYGYYRGCYFYGAGAFTGLAGRTCTSLTIRLARTGSAGIAGGENIWLAPHTHDGIPAGAPYFPVSPVNVGQLAWNGTGTFTLPVAWGQALIDGVYKGIGHRFLGTSDYAVFKGLAADSLSGQISLGWT